VNPRPGAFSSETGKSLSENIYVLDRKEAKWCCNFFHRGQNLSVVNAAIAVTDFVRPFFERVDVDMVPTIKPIL
jgi:hypothetical protein